MDKKIIDMNSPRERLFGWFPYERAAKIFILGNIAYVFFCCFVWPKLPPRFIWGWWTTHLWTTNFIICNWAAAMWGIYYYKFWPLLNDEDGDEKPQKEVNINE